MAHGYLEFPVHNCNGKGKTRRGGNGIDWHRLQEGVHPGESRFLIVHKLHAEDEEKEEESNDNPGVCAVEIGDVLEPGLCKHTCRPLSGKGYLTAHLSLVGALTTYYILSMLLRKEVCILKQN